MRRHFGPVSFRSDSVQSLFTFFFDKKGSKAKNKALEDFQRPDLGYSTQTSCIIRFEHPVGIEYSTERLHTALLVNRCKVTEAILSLIADFGLRNVQPKPASASKSAVLSLLLSLHEQRKERGTLCRSKRKLKRNTSKERTEVLHQPP